MTIGFMNVEAEMLEKFCLFDSIYVKKSFDDYLKDYNKFIPVKIIFNKPRTICYWDDGTKTIVICGNGDTFSEEVGVLQCIARKVFNGNRSALLKLVENAYHQPVKNEE